MFHLLGGLDAHFLSQITDVIISESAPEEVSIDATGEATANSVASGQPVHGDLLPSTSSSEDAEFLHAHPMVGSPTAKLESGEGDRGRSLILDPSTVLENQVDVIDQQSSSTPSSSRLILNPFPLINDHLLDHAYFACPQPMRFEEVASSTSDVLNANLTFVNPANISQTDSTNLSDIPIFESAVTATVTRGLKLIDTSPTKRERRDSSNSSIATHSADEHDSAYDSPHASPSFASPLSSPLWSSVASSTSEKVSSKNTSTHRHKRQEFQRGRRPKAKPSIIETPSSDSLSSPSKDCMKETNRKSPQVLDGESDAVGDLDNSTTLDLDLLNSLLTKDILDDMGQVILNHDLGDTTTEMLLPNDAGSSCSTVSDLCNSDDYIGDDSGDIFAGIFGDFNLSDGKGGGNNILDSFDGDDWESTFNDFYRQLNA